MSCERYRDALTDLAAGAPAPAGIEAHLASCEGCPQELAALRRALEIADGEMARLVADEPSPALAARIRRAVADRDAAPAWRFGWAWPAVAAAAMAAVALAAWFGRTAVPSPQPQVAVDAFAGHSSSSREGSAPPPDGRSAVPPAGTASEPGGTTAPPGRDSAERPQVRGGGGSLGTRHVGVPRDDESRRVGIPRDDKGRQVGVPRDGKPEVLVPRGEAEALVRFAAIVHRGRHAPGAFLTAGQPSPDLVEPTALAIEPLEIVPLDPAENPGT